MENHSPKLEMTRALPKLPIPTLKHTFDRLLMTLEPVLSREEHQDYSRQVSEFIRAGGVGEGLQEALAARRESLANWSLQWWLEDMYLHVSLALPVNSNPGMVFPRRHFNSQQQMLFYAAHLIHGAYEWKCKLDREGLPVDRCRSREPGQPLCMEQYHRVMSSCRRPRLDRDLQLDTTSAQSHYIVVCVNGMQFKLSLIEDDKPLNVLEISDQLSRCHSMAGQSNINSECHVGLLTSDNRPLWAQNREQLVKIAEKNERNLIIMENCLFVVCLDNSREVSDDVANCNNELICAEMTHMMANMLHGCGSQYNSKNRWFDKDIQLIFGSDGMSGLCYEHSTSEGVVVVQLMEQLINEYDQYMQQPSDDKTDSHIEKNQLTQPELLQFTINDNIKQSISQSASNIDKLVDNLDFVVMRYNSYGKKMMKKFQCSPDAFMQVALQLAYFTKHGCLVSTYESASTRRYQQGRVDCIRAVNPVVLNWIKCMHDKSSTKEQKISLLRSALQLQTEVMVENISGHGIDIHLLALRQLAAEMAPQANMPTVFNHSAFAKANHFALSTSQVTTIRDETCMGYGPVVADGYGCSYNIHDDNILLCVSSLHSCDLTGSLDLGTSIARSLDDMRDLLGQV